MSEHLLMHEMIEHVLISQCKTSITDASLGQDKAFLFKLIHTVNLKETL